MLLSIFDDMQQCTADEVDRMLPLVSEQRRSEALRFKHVSGRFSCLKSYLMLHDLLVRYGRIAAADSLRFVRNQHGKPSIEDRPDIYFNISHCRCAVVVAVDACEIGVDVESFRSPSEGLLRYTMSESEIGTIRQSDHPDQQFAAYWTKKEALYKYLGTGIRGDIPHLLDSTPGDVKIETTLVPAQGYAYSLAMKV